MQRLQAYKFELRPNGKQRYQMRCFAGSCRFVWNRALAMQKKQLESKQATTHKETTTAEQQQNLKKTYHKKDYSAKQHSDCHS